ncbi:GNAT family protein [Niallia taxi]|uniref:GNAT family N-acetyltransferase n=1 Tax=Niallia taxi TaxID=2499688 RepID=UPI002E1ED1FC|nr:GNAT family protein [Niallia taxi]
MLGETPSHLVSYEAANVLIRQVTKNDLYPLWEMAYKEERPEWKKWDAPYYEHQAISWEDFQKQKDKYLYQDDFWAIETDGKLIGTVSYYWEHKPSNWLEMGIVLYDPKFWSGGYGTKALKLWINHLFQTLPLVRVGFTTWSGNRRMMKVGEKLGMQLEARLRKCRFYNGVYYDSIRMGLLREEWEKNKRQLDNTVIN